MESIKYVYIDDRKDEAERIIEPYVNKDDRIYVFLPNEFNDIIKQELSPKKYNGIILDQRLDEEKGESVRGTSWAQYLRTLATENEIPSYPIVLFTSSEKQRIFDKDTTSQDLFDAVYIKDGDEVQDRMWKELKSLANAYTQISANKQAEKLLDITKDDFDLINSRFVDKVKELSTPDIPDHELALFLLNEVIRKNGLLIDEDVLAARLGVQKTDPCWEELKTKLQDCKYQGIFGEAWERWWMYRLEHWWEAKVCDKDSLTNLNAAERVGCLNEKFALKLIPAKPTEKSDSSEFWTVCIATKKPIDTMDGILIDQKPNYSWQDSLYISMDEAINETKKEQWKKVDPTEKERVKQLKDQSVETRY